MASYKVPQDVEADDKLLGPFSFRQFIYLMIVGGAIVLAVALFQIFPLLAILPIPVAIFFTILALPLKKDQPMETYLAAIVSFYLKPNRRFWIPGQSESTVLITAPKKVEENRVRNITQEEASHRLSFLSNIIDTEGYAIKNANSPMRDEFYAEAYNTTDMFDHTGTTRLSDLITKEQQEHHAEVVNQMRNAIEKSNYNPDKPLSTPSPIGGQKVIQPLPANKPESDVIVQPTIPPAATTQMTELANNPDFSVETIEQQADRIRRENESEVYIPLH